MYHFLIQVVEAIILDTFQLLTEYGTMGVGIDYSLSSIVYMMLYLYSQGKTVVLYNNCMLSIEDGTVYMLCR